MSLPRAYLDHAATTPLAPDARAAMAGALAAWANPSSPHREGRAARAALEGARARIAGALGWTGALIFTSGVSESAAIALGRGTRPSIVSAVEHAAVLGARRSSVSAPVGADGVVDAAALATLLAAHPGAIVAIQHVNSETGVIQPIDTLRPLVSAAGGILFCDAAQSAGKLALPEADLIAVSAHKLGGPPGIGALLVRDLACLEPWGQGQERGYRPGTENVPAALGFAAALESREDGWIEARASWRAMLEREVCAEGALALAADAPRSPLIGAYAMPGMSAAAQLMRLDALGFAVSAGSACSSGSMRPSHVLAAMGVAEDVAARTIRVSFGRTTTEDEVRRFAAAWIALAREASARGMIYLDYQATTPLAPEAREAMLPWLDRFGNPHSPHRPGREARAAVELARDQVAASLPPGGKTLFTSGATEALNWAIKGAPPGGIVTIATEHAAVLDAAAAEARLGRAVTVLPVGEDGLVDPAAAERAIVPGTALVAAMLVNNEIGVIQPIAALAALARKAGAWLLCDAVQGFGRVPLPEGCDMIALSAHKIHGPKGIGALWLRDGVAPRALLDGGGQEGGLRSGTLSPMLCAGFGAAVARAAAGRDADARHVAALFDRARDRLGAAWKINGSIDDRYRGNLNLRRADVDAGRLISELREVAFSAGSACASGSGRPSHVLRAIGLDDAAARSSIRLGFGRYTTMAEIDEAATLIEAAVARQLEWA